MFQDFALLPRASVIRSVAFGLERRGTANSARKAIAEKSIRAVGLAGFEPTFPHQLSGGMRQRVGLARALSVKAQVLLHEPFDQTRRKFQQDLLHLVKNAKKTFIFVAPSIKEAVYASDQIAIRLPRRSRVSEIIRPSSFRDKGVAAQR